MAEELVEKIRYEADISQITGELRKLADKQDSLASDTEKHSGRMGKALGGLKDRFAGGGGIFSMIAGGGAVMLVQNLISTGNQLDALDKKAATVFSGSSLASVQKWASGVAGSFGMTTAEAVNMAAGMGDLLKPMGFTADQAAGMATKMADLSGALSAWTGGQQDAAQVADTITAAMLGERDGLKSLGISISQADVDARVAANGGKKLAGAALQQAQAIATQQLIMEKSTDAQAAWSNGAMDGIKAQNQSSASMRQLTETITRAVFPILQKLVPIFANVTKWIGDRLPGALKVAGQFLSSVLEGGKRIIEDLAGAFGTSEGTIKKVLIGIAAGLVAVAIAWNAGPGLIVTAIVALVAGFLWAYENVDWFRKGVQIAFLAIKIAIGLLVKAFQWIVDKIIDVSMWVGKKVADIVGFVTGIPDRIRATISTLWNGLKDGITAAKDWVRDRILDVVNFAINLPRRIGNAFSGMWDGIKNAFRSALNWIIDKWNDFHIPAISLPVIGQVSPQIDFPNLPRFHSGGITNFGSAGQGLALLRNNEAVIPLDNAGDARRVAGRAGLGHSTVIENMTVVTNDSPRRFFDEGMWRVA